MVVLFLAFAALLAGGIIPQRIATSAAKMTEWRNAYPLLTSWADRLGLFHVFSTPGFAVVLFLAFVSLTLSSLEQFKTSYRKTFSLLHSLVPEYTAVSVTADELRITMRREGYLPLGADDTLRFVRHPWGYWGGFLLHAGMTVTMAASLYVALTGQWGRLNLVRGEVHQPAQPWVVEERGLLASLFMLPASVRFDGYRLNFGPGGRVEGVTSDISFLSGPGEDKRSVAINAMLHYRGLRVYQSTDYGDAFTLEFSGPDGTIRRERLLMPHPLVPDQAGYADFGLPWLERQLSAKYYVDSERRSLMGGNPLLVLRLLDHGIESTRVSLRTGETGVLGEQNVRLVGVEKWTGLIFVNVTGMTVIFCGFLIVVCGAALNYMAVPREIIARATPGGYSVSWRAVRFADFYRDEYWEILKKLGEGPMT